MTKEKPEALFFDSVGSSGIQGLLKNIAYCKENESKKSKDGECSVEFHQLKEQCTNKYKYENI